jgi:DNA modification methylase
MLKPGVRASKKRRPLTHVGGPIELWGDDAAERSALQHALDVRSEEKSILAHVHGFHAYPARLHPVTAARLIEGFSRARSSLLDPFCGSGTVLVEGRRLGRRALGSDVNPLAVELCRLKTRSTTAEERQSWLDAGARVVEHAEERRTRRAGPSHRYSATDRELYEVHVLLELDGLRDGITRLPRGATGKILLLVLSAILGKVSRKPGNTPEERAGPRLASGHTIRLFARKLRELADKSAQYTELVPRGTPEARVWQCDARSLEPITNRSVDLIVCSPPYPGVYDYSAQHAQRMRWLGMDARSFKAQEIGSRRALAERDFEPALRIWKDELGQSLQAMRRVLDRRGSAIVIMADSVLARRAVHADKLLTDLAGTSGFRVTCRGSQARPHFHGPTQQAFRQKPRAEHVLVLRPI